MTKRILMIAGPNGAGKTTTFAGQMQTFKQMYEFINADEIAQAIAPQHPESVALQASKLMIKRLRELLELRKSFAFETTASARSYLKYLIEAKKTGYEITCIFLWLYSPEQAIDRVMQRVKQGGHNIPHETIRRRYYLGLENILKDYLPLADNALILDNSSEKTNQIIAVKNKNENLRVINENVWNQMQRCLCK